MKVYEDPSRPYLYIEIDDPHRLINKVGKVTVVIDPENTNGDGLLICNEQSSGPWDSSSFDNSWEIDGKMLAKALVQTLRRLKDEKKF